MSTSFCERAWRTSGFGIGKISLEFRNGPKKKRGVNFGLQEREGWEGGGGDLSP